MTTTTEITESQWTDGYEWTILETTEGPRCGNHHGRRVRHGNAASVRECYRITRAQDLQIQEELAAEAAVERFFEDRGYWEARAQEDWEMMRGIMGR